MALLPVRLGKGNGAKWIISDRPFSFHARRWRVMGGSGTRNSMNNQAINPTDSRPTQRSLRAKGLLRFAVQVTANALAVMLVLTLLSQIHLQHGSLLTYLLVGLLFSLTDNLPKPLFIFLGGQLLILSPGFFLFVVTPSRFLFLFIFLTFY